MFIIYTGAKRDGLNYHLAYIPKEFTEESQEAFDREYMNRLYEFGYNLAKEGYAWKKAPPGYIPK